jgi:small subunit ribosomal protein S2
LEADLPIAGNDDAIRSVRVILGAISAAITQGRAEFESTKSRQPADEGVAGAEAQMAVAAESIPLEPAAEAAPPAPAP